MKTSHFILATPDPDTGYPVIKAQGIIDFNVGPNHASALFFDQGFKFRKILPMEKLEPFTLFDTLEELDAFVRHFATKQPPVDNKHVAAGCEQFSEDRAPIPDRVDIPPDQAAEELPKGGPPPEE